MKRNEMNGDSLDRVVIYDRLKRKGKDYEERIKQTNEHIYA